MKILPFFCLLMAASLATDLGRSATLSTKQQNLNGKTYDLTAASMATQVVSATHQAVRVVIPDPSHACSQMTFAEDQEHTFPIYLLVQGRDGGCTYGRDQIFTALSKQADKSFTAVLNIGDKKDKKEQYSPVTMELWVSSLNKESYDLMLWFQKALAAIPDLSKHLNWRPRYALVSNIRGNRSEYVSSCACDGMFCSPQQHGKSSNVLVRQDIRQMLVFKDYPSKYLPYARMFTVKCYDKYVKDKHADQCASSVLDKLEIDGADINRRIDNFLKSCTDVGEPLKLYQEMTLDRVKTRHVSNYPVVILDHQQIQAKNQVELKKAFCRKLGMEKEEGCSELITKTSMFDKTIAVFFWLIFVAGLLVAGVFAVFYFRRKMKKEVNKELKMQVSTAVEHYYQLSEANETK